MECQKESFNDIPEIDRNVIKGVPWAENMWSILHDGLNKSFLYWCQMVLKMGENEDVVKGWVNIFIKAYEETCCELVMDMERVQSNVLSKIEQLLQEFQQLCDTLQINMPILGDTTRQLSLYQEQQELKKRIDEYKKLIQVKLAELNKLREKQLDLCNSLGKQPKILKDNPLPSPEEIEEFQKHVEKLEAEKFNRLETFFSVKEEILKIVNELKLEPSSQFEINVFSPDDSLFLVTDENMKQLDILHKNLIEQHKNVNEEIAHLRLKIDDYWNLLDVDLKEREDFRQKYVGNTVEVLHGLRIEVKQYEELKKANIKVFIDKLRQELEQLWEKCHCSQVMRMEFGFFHSDCYNEDLLELHEVEIAKWKKYYDENKELLTLLERHSYLWNKMVELEENAKGPNRYNNRGGQLLKEEKERNKLAKQIPQIETEIGNLAEQFKQRHNCSFTSHGVSVIDYLSNLHEDRENAKKQKLSARKFQREQTLTPAKSAMNLFPSTSHIKPGSTPLSTTKRKLATPLVMDTKKVKVLSERKDNKSSRTPLPSTSTKSTFSTTHAKRLSVERKKRLNKIRRISAHKEKKINPNETFTADYGEFQNELSNRGDCRSTILASETPCPTPKSSKALLRPPTTRHPTPMSSSTMLCPPPINTPRTPRGKTPTSVRLRPRTPDCSSKFSSAKSNVKLIF